MKHGKNFLKTTALFLVITAVFSLCSCSSNNIEVNTAQNSKTYVPEEDCQNYLPYRSRLAKADGGYYFVSSDANLCYYDVESKESYPVCNKANCPHEDSDCLAFLSPLQFYPAMDLYYYDNGIYLLGHENEGNTEKVYMYRFSPENFKIKKAAYLFNSTNGLSLVCMMHRGYVYFSNSQEQMKESTAELYRVKLGDTGENAPEKIFEYKAIGAGIASLSAYGNNVFFSTYSYADTQGNGYETSLRCIDIHNLKSKEILDDYQFSRFAENNYIYYENNENTVSRLDINTGEEEFFCNINGPCYISADSNYIYFDNLQRMYIDESFKDRKIFVYDKKGNFVTEIVPKNPKDDCCFGGDDVMIFREIIQGEVVESNGAEGYYALDKSQLTSPDKEFIDMD